MVASRSARNPFSAACWLFDEIPAQHPVVAREPNLPAASSGHGGAEPSPAAADRSRSARRGSISQTAVVRFADHQTVYRKV